MNAFVKQFENIVKLSEQPVADGDFYGEDGLLRCGKCGERKQTRTTISLPGKEPITITPGVACACRKAQYDEIVAKQKIEKLRSVSMMDLNAFGHTFDGLTITPHNEKAIKVAKRYVERFDQMYENNQGLLFYGPPGTGKTHLATCIANALLEKQVNVVMTTFIRIAKIGLMRNDDDSVLMGNVINAQLLIIDDLGAERGTEFAQEQVYSFIDKRNEKRKPTIITTNLSMEQLKKPDALQQQRIYDRILQRSFPVEIAGPSWRKKEAGARYYDMKKLLEED